MADSATILAQFMTQGDEEFIAKIKQMATVMEGTGSAAAQLTDRISKLYDAQKLSSSELLQITGNLDNITKQLNVAEKERQATLSSLNTANQAYNATLSRQDAEMAKVATMTQQLNATPLGRFTQSIYGSAGALEQMSKNSYEASQQAALFSRAFATQPITALKTFAASTEKAAIASQFLRQQIAFLTESRFGTIMIGFAVFGAITKAIRETIDATAEMDKAVHYVASAFLESGEAAANYGQIQRQIQISSIMTGKSFEDVGKVMWELKSAGLSAAETFAFLDTNMKLAALNNSNLSETIRLTVGLYRTFGDTIKVATTPMEKMAYIGDTLIYALNQSAADLPGIMQAYKYTASTAALAGVSFEELTAAIIVVNNHMLQASIAGTSLNQMFIHLAENAQKVAKAFDIKIDTTKQIQFANIIDQINKNGKIAAMSIDQFTITLDAMGVRGARAFATLIKNPEEFKKVYGDVLNYVQKGDLARVFGVQIDNLTDQWNRFKQAIRTGLVFEDVGTATKQILKNISDMAEAAERFKKAQEQRNAAEDQSSESARRYHEILKNITEEIHKQANPMGILAQRSLEIAKHQEEWASQLGATNEQFKNIFKSNQEITGLIAKKLTDEQNFNISVAQGTATLGVQLTHYQQIADAQLRLILLAEQRKASEAEIDKIIKQYVEAMRSVSALEKQMEQQAKQQEQQQKQVQKAYEQQSHALEQNVQMINKITEAFIQSKKATPLREMELMAVKMQDALNVLNRAAMGTNDWRQGTEAVYKAYLNIANVQNQIQQAVEQIISQTQKLQSIGAGYVDALISKGALSRAKAISIEMEEQARIAREAAKTDAQKIEANNLIINALKEQLKIDENNSSITREIINIWDDSWEIQKKATAETVNQYNQVQNAAKGFELIRQKMENILTNSKEWPKYISTASTEAGAMQTRLQDVDRTVESISNRLDNLANKIRNMPKLNIGGGGANEKDMLTNANYQ